ncbi:MAG: hypothetical protein ACFFCS_00810 [Candidatus Hodarchaeota archaeon]
MNTIIWGILLGTMASCTMNLGKAMQKHGLEVFEYKKKIEGAKRAKKGVLWGFGAAEPGIRWVLFKMLALSFIGAKASEYSSMAGIGLVILLIYSSKILKEVVGKPEIIGSCLIIAGSIMFVISSLLQGEPKPVEMISWPGFATSFILMGIILGTAFIFTMKTKKFWGVIWGIIAGSCAGIDNVITSMGKIGNPEELGMAGALANAFTYIAIPFAIGAFLLTNVGYSRGKAITVVPAYNSFYMIIPIILDLTIFGFVPLPFQIAGLALSVIGVVLVTAFKKELPKKEPILEEPVEKTE